MPGWLAVFAVWLACTGNFLPVSAQQAKLYLDPDTILIGQQARLVLELEIPSGSTVIWPAIRDTITADIEILQFGMPDTVSRGRDALTIRQTHTITAWREGFLPVPHVGFTVISAGDTIHIEAPAALLEVRSIGIDPESDIRDIKGIIRIPSGLREMLPFIAAALLILLAAWLLRRLLRRPEKPRQEAPAGKRPQIPAHIAALSRLQGLRSKKLWQAGRVKQYHSELSFILRAYLKARFGMQALEMTTPEVLDGLARIHGTDPATGTLRQVLELADLVKFAKFLPAAADNEASMDQAIAFVEQTKLEEQDAA